MTNVSAKKDFTGIFVKRLNVQKLAKMVEPVWIPVYANVLVCTKVQIVPRRTVNLTAATENATNPSVNATTMSVLPDTKESSVHASLVEANASMELGTVTPETVLVMKDIGAIFATTYHVLRTVTVTENVYTLAIVSVMKSTLEMIVLA